MTAEMTSAQRDALRFLRDGLMSSRMLGAAVRLGLPEALADGPLGEEELAQKTGTHPRSVGRLTRALAALEVFEERADGRFALTRFSELLLPSHPSSMRAAVLYYDAPWVRDAWRDLEHGVRTGEVAFEHAHGASYWSYLDQHPDEAANFNEFLAKMRPYRHAAVVAAYDFSGVGTVVDIGGGYGQQLVKILEANAGVNGILFDASSLESGATESLRAQGVGDRCRFVGGDFFREVPAGGDVYILGDVIHDWSDADSVKILSSCRRAMGPKSRLLLVEWLLSPEAMLADMHMMVLFGEARQRTEAEFAEILEASGLALVGVTPTESEASIVEASLAA